MNALQTFFLGIIALGVVITGIVLYQKHQESESKKPEPIMCIVGAATDCQQ